MAKWTPEKLIGLPMHGASSPEQLCEILNVHEEHPDASADEIAGVTGHPTETILSVIRGFRK